MDFLGTLMSISDEEDHERGRPRQLKSYLIESNSQIPSEFVIGNARGIIKSTGLPNIRTIQIESGGIIIPFFLDTTDKRFWILHTNAKSKVTKPLMEKLIVSDTYEFDQTWFASSMLKDISTMAGNSDGGWKTSFLNLFLEEGVEAPVEELRIDINGKSSDRAFKAIQGEKDIQDALAFSRVRIKRGSRPIFAEDDFNYHGIFVVKDGTSIDDHISLVESAKTHYQEKMKEIENFRIGVKTVDERTLVEGKAFDFDFKRSIDDIQMFMDRLISKEFRLWGLKTKISNDHHQFLAVDLHTGDPFDLEVTENLIRVYLPKGSCGNVVLRLLVNMQHYFDSNTKCSELGISGAIE